MRISVVVPTYRRPQWLSRCVDALALQRRAPDEVVIALREKGDEPGVEMAARLAERHRDRFPVLRAPVAEGGFLPPLLAGRRAATGDIVCFIDDDAEADPDWLSRLLPHYDRPDVGGVGGSTPRFDDRGRVDFGTTDEVGRLRWYGALVGDYHKELRPSAPRDVHFLMGGSASYRREVLDRLTIDLRLNRQSAYLYEVDLGLQVLRLGYRLVFDPEARVRHYLAPRPEGVAERVLSPGEIRAVGHNYAYVLLKHLDPLRRSVLLAYLLLVGSSHCPGLAWLARETIRGNRGGWSRAGSSWRGVLEGVASHRRWKAGHGFP